MNLMADAEPIRVYASGGQAVNFIDFTRDGASSDIDDHAFVIIDYANGVRGNFTLNMFCHDFTEDLSLCGDKGRLTAKEIFNVHERQPSKATITLELGEGGASKESDVTYSRDIEESGHHGATYFEHIAFVDQIEGKATQSSTPLEGLWSMIVACAAQTSISEGQAIHINEFMKSNDLSKFLN
jgi:predicted dehydrogenase